jgi:tetratricopeptide (TPR) repeat protein
MLKRACIILAVVLASGGAYCASAFLEKGEEAFLRNNPQEAKPLLEGALNEDPANEKIYLYLGIVYQQLGDLERAIAILGRGVEIAKDFKDLMYYNRGNDFFARKEYTFAEEMYTRAVTENQNLAEAYLNRANSRIRLQNLNGALADYLLFIQLRPQDPQRPKIEQVIRLLQQNLDQLAAKQKEEADRQKALLNDVLNALENAGEGTKNLSVESIEIKQDPLDMDIKD